MTAEEWNERNAVGTRVAYWPVLKQCRVIYTTTRTRAYVLPQTGDPVVKLDGKSGPVLLSHVRVREQQELL